MPTAVETVTTENGLENHSGTQSPSSSSSSSPRRSKQSLSSKTGAKKATLRVLYERAKHAFLQRDLLLANDLLTQAFSQLGPPPSSHGGADVDSLDSQRRKWDILRITLHTTLYTSQSSDQRPSSASSSSGSHFNPASLPPYQFLQGLHSQSLTLFNPSNVLPSIGNVPDQVVLLLVVSAVKLGEVHLAKEWVEDWLVRRDVSSVNSSSPTTTEPATPTSYERIVDVYILHVLPRLGLWDDATEFMRYESEMGESAKERMLQALNAQHLQYTNGSQSSNGRPSRSRSTSPTPSLASTISSNGTVSAAAAHAPSRPASAASISSTASTVTVRPSRAQQATALAGDRTFSMTSLATSPLGREQKGEKDTVATNGYVVVDSKSTQNATVSPFGDVSHTPGKANGSLPLPIPPLYQNSQVHGNSPQGTTVTSSGQISSLMPFVQSYVLHFYIRLARILNTQFGLDLPVDFDVPPLHVPSIFSTYKPTIWHVVFVFLPIVFILRRVSRRSGGQVGAGDAARLKLRAQRMNTNLALGPYLGAGFWKAAMRAVGDAVSMGGRGLI